MSSILSKAAAAGVALTVIAGSPLPAGAQQRYEIVPQGKTGFSLSLDADVPARANRLKLSDDLRDSLKVKGSRFVGVTRQGAAVVEFDSGVQPEAAHRAVGESGLMSMQLFSSRAHTAISRFVVIGAPALQSAERVAGLRVVNRSVEGRFVVVEAEGGLSEAAAEALAAAPGVEYVQPNYPYYLQQARTPNDPHFRQLWGMANARAMTAWSRVTTSDVIVAVIDSGVDYRHPDLNIWKNPGEIAGNGRDDDRNGYVDDVGGYNFVAGNNDPMDGHGHGTHVAGTIGARGNNGQGVAGVAWGVSIMPIKLFGDRGEFAGEDNAVRAIDYALRNGARIINASWGGPKLGAALKEAIRRAEEKDVLIVAAAGNTRTDLDVKESYPAAFINPNILSVMAINRDETVYSDSSYGRTKVHLAAPGGDIYSTWLTGVGGYGAASGTSMATPHVAGAAALVWAHPAYRGRPLADIRAALLRNARRLPSLRDYAATGGTLDLAFLGTPGGIAAAAPSVPTAALMMAAPPPVPDAPPAGTVTTVTGTLQIPHFALGAETTGVIIRGESGPVEIELGRDSPLLPVLRRLDGETISIRGRLETRPGVAVPVRRILTPAP